MLSNFKMALVPFKNLLRFPQKKCSKHLKIDQKDLSQVAKFVSHDGSLDLPKKNSRNFWWKNSKLKENPEKTQDKIPKKLKNRQLQLSWVAKKNVQK